MNIDIVFVTYNSEKWIVNCVKSILENDYDLKKVNIIFYDNCSKDKTLKILKETKKEYENNFNSFKIIEGNLNRGFGYGNNEGAKEGNSDYIFFLNIDTELKKDTLSKINEKIKKSNKEVAMWELCQEPYEHPKYYDPITGYTSWASGACMIVKREVFNEVNGFDENIFMYCEDVELSWNFRKHGYKIQYLYDVKIKHFSYNEKYEFKYTQFVYGFLSNMYIRSKYGSLKNYLRGIKNVSDMAYKGRNIPADLDKKTKKRIQNTSKQYLIKNTIPLLIKNIKQNKIKSDFKPSFIAGLDYEIIRDGAFYTMQEIKSKPLVSIIVRTCNRPDTLRETLISLRNQTYKNIEIVIVEDGKPTAKEMIENEFKDLNIVYQATGKNKGRSAVGNIGMQTATGKYMNFLDDDDVFYPDHVEVLVSELEANNYEIVYDSSFETQINIKSKKPYQYDVINIGKINWGEFYRLRLYKHNMFPIQTVMFKRELFEECGGLDETIDALEDWDFWVRLSLKHNFNYVEKTTSIFRTPAEKKEQADRNEFLLSTLKYLDKKFQNYRPEFTVSDYNKW